MKLLRKFAFTAVLFSSTAMFADMAINLDVDIKNHRIEYGRATRLAYQLADLAEAMSYGAMSMNVATDINIKDHRAIRYRAERLHQAASDLYYLLQGNRGFSVGTLDHREDSVRNAFWSVSNAYHNLNAVAYGYSMQRITNVFYNLSYAIQGY